MVALLGRIWTGWRETMNQIVVTRVKHLLGVIVVAFACFFLIIAQVISLTAHDRTADRRDAAAAAYQAQLSAYSVELVQYEECLDDIVQRTTARDVAFTSAESKRRIIAELAIGASEAAQPRISALYAIVDEEAQQIEEKLPVIPREACPAAPPEVPRPPSILE